MTEAAVLKGLALNSDQSAGCVIMSQLQTMVKHERSHTRRARRSPLLAWRSACTAREYADNCLEGQRGARTPERQMCGPCAHGQMTAAPSPCQLCSCNCSKCNGPGAVSHLVGCMRFSCTGPHQHVSNVNQGWLAVRASMRSGPNCTCNQDDFQELQKSQSLKR
jgi:hypothetical protein